MLSKPWTDEDQLRLRKLHAAGASAVRASLALKKNLANVRAKARELGIPFQTKREWKKRHNEKEVQARTAALITGAGHSKVSSSIMPVASFPPAFPPEAHPFRHTRTGFTRSSTTASE